MKQHTKNKPTANRARRSSSPKGGSSTSVSTARSVMATPLSATTNSHATPPTVSENFCMDCNKQFEDRKRYMEHRHSVHSTHTVQCPFPECAGLTFTPPWKLKNHKAYHHKGEMPSTFYCGYGRFANRCQLYFPTQADLDEHSKLYRPFACTHGECTRRYKAQPCQSPAPRTRRIGANECGHNLNTRGPNTSTWF